MSAPAAPDVSGISDRWGGNPGQWRRFFCQKEFDQMFFWTNSGGFKGRILYVVHGALECTFYPPDLTYRGMTFLNYPTLFPHDPSSPGPATLYEQVATDMREADVVLGRCRGLDNVAGELRRRAGSLDLVMVSWACLPTIIGDDEAAVIDSWRKAAGCPVLVNSIQFRMGRSFSLHEKLFEEWRKRPGFLDVPRDPSAVNLWGCAAPHFREELGPVLERLGIRVNMRLLPEIEVAALDRVMAAACQVVSERMRRFQTVQRMLDGLPMPTVCAAAPYGLAGSREHALTIAKAFGREGPFADAWSAASGAARERWEMSRRQTHGQRLAFVVDEDSARTLLDPLGQTLPVLRMVCEMGFGLDFLVYSPGGELQSLARQIAAFPGMTETPGFEGFADRGELAELLSEGGFRAVYSDVRNDERLTRACKAQFSMRMFEPGLAGAVRSLERLLGACRLPFYERYGRYLSAVGDGDE